FERMVARLEGYTHTAVISFIDLYPKLPTSFREVMPEQRLRIGKTFVEIANARGMTLKPCAEGEELAPFGADCGGCMRISDYEKAIGKRLRAPKTKGARPACACHISCDIGAYNTCRHLCKYCYANADPERVLARSRRHDPLSPFIVGNYEPGDVIRDVSQESWADPQTELFSEER
ncbi:MAG: DUF1848 family protein, partial [Abditibacteriota bacterium]|nr:DUF1848 family protein [Abditibacteriota bacterium]